MKSNDENWTAFLDPKFSILELSSSLGRRGVQYLDVVTGWQPPRWTESVFQQHPRRERGK
jgi:hypothetical protein